MKKVLSIFITLLILISAPVVHAQASFILGVGAGLLFGNSEAGIGSSPSVIYTMSRVSERVKQQLQVKQIIAGISINSYSKYKNYPGSDIGFSLRDNFDKALHAYNTNKRKKDPSLLKNYEILQVVRLFGPDGSLEKLLFTFIEKDKVISLD